MMNHSVRFAQFTKVGLTIARTVQVNPNLKAKIPAYVLKLDFRESLVKV